MRRASRTLLPFSPGCRAGGVHGRGVPSCRASLRTIVSRGRALPCPQPHVSSHGQQFSHGQTCSHAVHHVTCIIVVGLPFATQPRHRPPLPSAPIACSRLQSRAALAALMEAAERHLPQAKRNALLRRYRQSGVQLARRDRRQGTSGWLGDDAGDEAAAPATFASLPSDVIRLVFQRLDPLTLARAACVSREWRGAASEGALWQAHCAALAGPGRSSGADLCAHGAGAKGNAGAGMAAGGQRRPGSTAGSIGGSSWRDRFAALAAQHPERLQRWKTRRVLVAGRLVWLSDGEPLPARARHVGPEAIVAFCRSGGRLARSTGSSQSDSDSSDSDGGGADGRLTGRLRFWQL